MLGMSVRIERGGVLQNLWSPKYLLFHHDSLWFSLGNVFSSGIGLPLHCLNRVKAAFLKCLPVRIDGPRSLISFEEFRLLSGVIIRACIVLLDMDLECRLLSAKVSTASTEEVEVLIMSLYPCSQPSLFIHLGPDALVIELL